MTDTQKRFFDLANEYEELKEELNTKRENLDAVMNELGFDTYHQDPNTMLVYRIVKPNGTFIYFREIDYKRTAKEGERGGVVLSKKEAQEAGFNLTK